MKKKVKVLIADDDEMMRRGLKGYLSDKGMDVIEASNAEEALTLVNRHCPDAVVLDIVMPPFSGAKRDFASSEGVRVAREIKSSFPNIGVVLLSAYEDRGNDVWAIVQGGIKGLVYKLKGCIPSELEEAIHESIRNMVLIDAEVSIGMSSRMSILQQTLTPEEKTWVDQVLDNMERLTARELEIVECFAASRTVVGVGRDLHLSPKTVQNYVDKIYTKVGLVNMNEEKEQLRKATILIKAYAIHSSNTK